MRAERSGAVAEEKRERAVSPGVIGAIVIVVLVLLFALQNSESTEVRLLFFRFDAPLIFVIIGSALFGMLAGAILRYQRRHRT